MKNMEPVAEADTNDPEKQDNGKKVYKYNLKKCLKCNLEFANRNQMYSHDYYYHQKFSYKCIICNFSYRTLPIARAHVLKTHKIDENKCINFVKAILKKENVKPKPQKSPDAGDKKIPFYKKKTLHLIKCFNCYDCSGSFRTIKELFKHVKVHKDEILEV